MTFKKKKSLNFTFPNGNPVRNNSTFFYKTERRKANVVPVQLTEKENKQNDFEMPFVPIH